MAEHDYIVRPIEPEVLVQLRTCDDAGRQPRAKVDEHGGSPLRCCLRHSTAGDLVTLASYAPIRRWSAVSGIDNGAYDEVGPVFIHAGPCPGPSSASFPDEFRHAHRVLRAYNYDGTIRGGVLVEADGPFDEVLKQLFADPETAVVHARAVEFGCFMFAVDRRPQY